MKSECRECKMERGLVSVMSKQDINQRTNVEHFMSFCNELTVSCGTCAANRSQKFHLGISVNPVFCYIQP